MFLIVGHGTNLFDSTSFVYMLPPELRQRLPVASRENEKRGGGFTHESKPDSAINYNILLS